MTRYNMLINFVEKKKILKKKLNIIMYSGILYYLLQDLKYFMMLIEYEILSRNDSVAAGAIIMFRKSQDFN